MSFDNRRSYERLSFHSPRGTFPNSGAGENLRPRHHLGMGDGLNLDQRALAREIATRHHLGAELLDALARATLTPGQKKLLADYATEDLARSGFDLNYKLTDVGGRLEDLIDALLVQ